MLYILSVERSNLLPALEPQCQTFIRHNDNLINNPPHQLIIIPLQFHRLPINRIQHRLQFPPSAPILLCHLFDRIYLRL